MHTWLRSIFAVAALFAVTAGGAHAGQVCGCDVSPATVRAYDAALFIAGGADVRRRHMPFGAPTPVAGPPPLELAQPHWLSGYDPVRRLPLWVAYRLTAADVAARRKRTQCFRPDPRLDPNTGGTTCASYSRDGFDRGHMVPSADMRRSEQAMVDTYVFSNIAHQYPGFNRTLWRDLETRVRAMARLRGEIYVISGAVFDHDGDGLPDAAADAPYPQAPGRRSDAALASHFYKVVIVPAGGGAAAEIHAWLLRHENVKTTPAQSKRRLAEARVPLRVIERISGFDIAPALDAVATARN